MKTLFFSVCLFLASVSATAQQRYSQEMAQSQGKQWTHGKSWDYVNGLVAKSLLNLCEQYQYADWTGNYYQWAKEYADNAINPDGTFKNFKKGNIDNINSGKVLFALYKREKELDKQYNPQIQISAESETKRSIFREKDKTKRSKKESAQHSKSRNKSFVMTSVSAL